MRLVFACLVLGACVSAVATPSLGAQTATSETGSSASIQHSADALATRISVSFSDVPLRQALSTIGEQSHVRLMYSSDDLPAGSRVSLSDADVTVGAALQVVLANTDLRPVAMADGAVVLTTEYPHLSAIPDSSKPPATQGLTTATVEGRVIRSDGSPVPGATVSVLPAGDSTATGDSGRFVLHGLTPGGHRLLVRRVGFLPTLAAVTAAVQAHSVTVTLVRAVPVLPTVVTTTEIETAYRSVGLDLRMRAGLGQFLTYDQIQQRQARKLSELLEGVRGIEMFRYPRQFETFVGGTRGGGCVSFVLDGVPQNANYSQDAAGGRLAPDDADNMIDPSSIGAIEVYSAAERPAGFGEGHQTTATLPDPPQILLGPLTTVGSQPAGIGGAEQCVLVVIWTRARLGLTGGD